MPSKKDDVEIQVAEAVEGLQGEPNHLLRLSSGVVLRGKQAPPLALIKVMSAFLPPKIPTYFNATMGREMENPDDPAYKTELQTYQTNLTNAMSNALILLGTELAEVPKKFPRPEDDAWLEEYTEISIGQGKPENKSWRYLTWVTFKAVLTNEDMDMIQKEVGRLSGVPESAVKSAEEFPGRDEKSRKP